MTALEIQRFYWEACRAFLHQQFDVPAAALEVVARWQEVLDGLESLQTTGQLPGALIGSVDWVTKKHLLDEAGSDSSLECSQEDRHLLSRALAARLFPDAASRWIGRIADRPGGRGAGRADPASQLAGHHARVLHS